MASPDDEAAAFCKDEEPVFVGPEHAARRLAELKKTVEEPGGE
ncbi:MAG TPA: hypothetical protein VGG75_13830 [Trebonia sp.]